MNSIPGVVALSGKPPGGISGVVATLSTNAAGDKNQDESTAFINMLNVKGEVTNGTAMAPLVAPGREPTPWRGIAGCSPKTDLSNL